jgi:LysR family transcriptional regulator, nod-box dependent transcriptional activator
MRFKRLDLNLLVALDHMLKLRSISRAAEQMNLSQSAMSNALTRLRQYFDDPLLVQVGRRLELTPRAEAMQNSVRDILVRVDAAISSEAEFNPAQSNREFSILLSDFTMQVLMPHVLSLAHEASSTIRFCMRPQQTFPYLEIDRGEADLLIAPKIFASPEHPNIQLFDY